MNGPIRLERTIVLQEWKVSGTLAVSRKREWEPAVLKLALEHEGLTPEIVASRLLGGRQEVAGRLLDICKRLGLLEGGKSGFRATEAGRLAATTGNVLMPERGTWTFWTAADALLRHGIVAVAPWKEPSAFDERGKGGARDFKPLPPAILDATEQILDVPAGEMRAIRIEDLGASERGERVATEAKARIAWTIGLDQTRCRLTGRVGDHPFDADVPSPGEWTHERVWRALLRHTELESRWDDGHRALKVAFGETSEEERSRMARALRVKAPLLEGLGRFDDTTIERVDLQARSAEDAVLWARWRFFRALGTYATDGIVQEAYRQAAGPFGEMAGPCPSRAELVQLTRTEKAGDDGRPPPSFWWLQAPLDWSLEERSER